MASVLVSVNWAGSLGRSLLASGEKLVLCPRCIKLLVRPIGSKLCTLNGPLLRASSSRPLPLDRPIELIARKEPLSELVQWEELKGQTPSQLLNHWFSLSKFRLTSLVVMTTLAGYCMAFHTFDPTLLAATVAGTFLTSSSAASLNQFLEIPFDSQMARTRNRPLVLGQVSPLHAVTFSALTATAGLGLLYTFVNPLTTALAAVNLVLYSAIYTPMKRSNVVNTWVGSIVGAIPPVMGYTAATGVVDLSALILGGVLYSWQFPHFKALSWNLRNDYARAGYRMTSVTDPRVCLNTAFRHSILVSAYCVAACSPAVGLTSWWFAMDSSPFNVYLIYLSYKFKKEPTAANSRKLFRFSLVHLPAIILLMLIAKESKTSSVDHVVE